MKTHRTLLAARGRTCVDGGLIGQCVSSSLDERRHEAQFDVVLLQEGVLVNLPHFLDVAESQTPRELSETLQECLQMDLFFLKIRRHHDSPHVNLVECGEHGAGVLGLLQPLGDPQPHTVHLHLDRWREEKHRQVSDFSLKNLTTT